MKTRHPGECTCCDPPRQITVAVDDDGSWSADCPVHGPLLSLAPGAHDKLMRLHREAVEAER